MHARLKWILKDRIAVPCDDLLEWGRWMQTADRHVADTDIDEEVRVSTVFLGLDHSWSPESEPVLFETMVFGEHESHYVFGKIREYRAALGQWRYSTWADAAEGHERICQQMREQLAAALKAIDPYLPKSKA